MISIIFSLSRNLLTVLSAQTSVLCDSDICWFSGLGFGSILSKLRNSRNELVQIQVEVFDEKLHRDQAELEKDPTNLSLQQLFDIVSAKVRGT